MSTPRQEVAREKQNTGGNSLCTPSLCVVSMARCRIHLALALASSLPAPLEGWASASSALPAPAEVNARESLFLSPTSSGRHQNHRPHLRSRRDVQSAQHVRWLS